VSVLQTEIFSIMYANNTWGTGITSSCSFHILWGKMCLLCSMAVCLSSSFVVNQLTNFHEN
jgi:hypothetical protein